MAEFLLLSLIYLSPQCDPGVQLPRQVLEQWGSTLINEPRIHAPVSRAWRGVVDQFQNLEPRHRLRRHRSPGSRQSPGARTAQDVLSRRQKPPPVAAAPTWPTRGSCSGPGAAGDGPAGAPQTPRLRGPSCFSLPSTGLALPDEPQGSSWPPWDATGPSMPRPLQNGPSRLDNDIVPAFRFVLLYRRAWLRLISRAYETVSY